jgi:hypothetical protein
MMTQTVATALVASDNYVSISQAVRESPALDLKSVPQRTQDVFRQQQPRSPKARFRKSSR